MVLTLGDCISLPSLPALFNAWRQTQVGPSKARFRLYDRDAPTYPSSTENAHKERSSRLPCSLKRLFNPPSSFGLTIAKRHVAEVSDSVDRRFFHDYPESNNRRVLNVILLHPYPSSSE